MKHQSHGHNILRLSRKHHELKSHQKKSKENTRGRGPRVALFQPTFFLFFSPKKKKTLSFSFSLSNYQLFSLFSHLRLQHSFPINRSAASPLLKAKFFFLSNLPNSPFPPSNFYFFFFKDPPLFLLSAPSFLSKILDPLP